MRVGVEDAVPEDLVQHGAQRGAGQRVPVPPLLVGHLPRAVERDALQPLLHQEAGRGERVVDPGDAHRCLGRVSVAGRRHRRGVARLDTEVQFLPYGYGEAVAQVPEPEGVHRPGPVLEAARDGEDDVEIALDALAYPRTLDLDDDGGTAAQPRPVHLRDGGGGERHVLDPVEDLIDRLAELLVEHRRNLGPRRRGNVALEPASARR